MRRMLLLMLFLFALPGVADSGLEIVPLKHRTSEQVLPVLQPLVEKGGSISGSGDKILIRASKANRAQLRAALRAIDTPLRQLRITVMRDNGAGSAGQHYGTRDLSSPEGSQAVEVMEGGRALIRTGVSMPITLTQFVAGPNGGWVAQSTVIRDLGSGFLAHPTLNGDRVTVEILPQTETLADPVSGRVDSSHLATTVSGRLGAWISLGGINLNAATAESGGGHYGTRASLEHTRILLRVDALD